LPRGFLPKAGLPPGLLERFAPNEDFLPAFGAPNLPPGLPPGLPAGFEKDFPAGFAPKPP
jgi:hypothetical protein